MARDGNSGIMTEILWNLIMLLISAGFIGAFIRLVHGPHLPDRVIALDLISMLAMGFIITYAVRFNQPNFVDEATIIALITVLGTIAFANYLEKGP
jgi:multicomponent Na+:H+ antiporter subunit F